MPADAVTELVISKVLTAGKIRTEGREILMTRHSGDVPLMSDLIIWELVCCRQILGIIKGWRWVQNALIFVH